MTLEQCIRNIITTQFKYGDFFDTHAVIELILQNPESHLVYLQEFLNDYPNRDLTVFHRDIALRKIKPLTSDGIIKQISDDNNKAVSVNINGKLDRVALWQRIN